MEAVVKKRRSVIKRLKKEEARIAKQHGAADAKLQNVPTSTRKMRLVADLIRGKKVNVALSILKFQPKIGAQRLEKLLLSAISNWQAKNADARLEDADLFVKEIFVDGGRMLKRLRPAPQGRGHRVRKRSNHVSLTIDSLNAPTEVAKSEKGASKAKAEKPKAEKKAKSEAKPAAKKTSKKTDNK
jgi:large subunit ribosomal protein L22